MADRSNPVLRTVGEVVLIGTMAVYDSQAELSESIQEQWHQFRVRNPMLSKDSRFYGASPCTNDRKIHYLTGVAEESQDVGVAGERLTLAAGEYAVTQVDDLALLRDTWTWLLRDWLPSSGRQEKHAPEFERFSGISEIGMPIAPIRIWIPLEPLPGH
jgi:AraC family transcriptional regulator